MKANLILLSIVIFILSIPVLSENLITKKQLIIGIHPFIDREEIKNRFTPLAEFLSEITGKNFRVVISESYIDHFSRTGKNEYDISFLGPIGYLDIVANFGKKRILAILASNGSNRYAGRIFIRKGSRIKNLSELKINEIAFVNIKSTMGFVVPFYLYLKEKKIDKIKEKFKFLNSHNNVAIGVLCGDYFLS